MKAKMIIVASCVFALSIASCKKKVDPVDPVDPNPHYANVKITKVRVEEMPFVDGTGAGWDPNDGPDVKFTLYQAGTSVVKSDIKKDVVSANLPLEWNLSQAYVINNFDTEYQIKVEDDDTDLLNPDDLIGAYTFKANGYTSGYPASIVLSGNNGLKVVLYVQWYN